MVEYGGWTWALPSGRAALAAARASLTLTGDDFAAKVAELGGTRGAAAVDVAT